MSTTSEIKSIGGNIWKVFSPVGFEAERLAQQFELPLMIAEILTLRGITSQNADNFLNPKLQNLMPDPYGLHDMEKAAGRIAQTIRQKQKVAIIGDYDVDGATSSALLKLFLEANKVEVLVHIPERDEGYGPSTKAVDSFVAQGCELLITVDCGTTAFETFDYAKQKDLPVIVLDHHEAEARLPDVYAIVNPKRLDEEQTELQYLAAVGVVFMTIVAVNRILKEDGAGLNLMQWLDIVALGTVCDVVPLIGLNRAFVKQGLKVMTGRQNVGLKALIGKSAINEGLSSYHLAYVLGPKLNAGGRVGDSSLASKLLSSQNEAEADIIADKLSNHNLERKDIEAYVLLKAIETLEGTPQKYPMAFVYGHDWHQGVIGIVAGKLKEKYNLPAFVMSVEDGEVKGSSRSVAKLDIGALIMAAKEKGIITRGGGHFMAAGFSLDEDKIEEFREFAGNYISKKLSFESLVPEIEIDAVIALSAATPELATKMEVLEPYGAGNSEPKLLIKSVKINKADIVGSGHVRCFLGSNGGGSLKAIAFRAADTEVGKTMLAAGGEIFDVAGILRSDNWQGRQQVQFIIEDIMRS